MKKEKMIQIQNLTKRYVTDGISKTVIDNLSVNFNKTGLTCILGSSGCGKTTLLNLIGGLDEASGGKIIVGGRDIISIESNELDAYRNSTLGFVFQQSHLIPNMTVEENVSLALKLCGEKNYGLVNAYLKRMGVLELAYKYPNMLSGGEMQRVAIARAVVNSPKIILADEPTGALDDNNATEVMELLKELSNDRLVIMVTHSKELAEKYADRILRLKDGKIAYDSNVNEILEQVPVVETKGGKLSNISALGISFKNLVTDKSRSIIMSAIQCISVLVLCFVISIGTWFSHFANNLERDFIYAYPITVGASVDMTSSINKVLFNENKQGEKVDKVFIDKVMIDLYKNSISKKELTNEYMSYIEEMDKSLYDFFSYDYGYDMLSNIFIETRIGNATITTSLDKLYSEVEEAQTISSILNFQSIFSKLPSNYKEIIEGCEIIGNLPKNEGDIVLVIDQDGYISDYVMAMLGFYSKEELQSVLSGDFDNFKEEWDYNEILGKQFLFLNNNAVYTQSYEGAKYTKKGIYTDDISAIPNDFSDGVVLNITGIIKYEHKSQTLLQPGIYYTAQFDNYVYEQATNSKIVKDMKTTIEIVEDPSNDGSKYYNNPFTHERTSKENYLEILRKVGGATNPISLKFFTSSKENKEQILSYLDSWNNLDEKKAVPYADGFNQLVTKTTEVIDKSMASIITISVVGVLLTCIMTGVVSYQSARNRIKEFGIMRCMGARQNDIGKIIVFENGIMGFIAGIIGVALSYLATFIFYKLMNMFSFYFLPPYLSIAYMIAILGLNVLCAVLPARILIKKNPIKAVRQ